MEKHKLCFIVGVTLVISAVTMYLSKIREFSYEIKRYDDLPFGISTHTKFETSFFNHFSKEQDFIMAEPEYIENGVFDKLTTPNKYIILNDSHYKNIENYFILAQEIDSTLIIYTPQESDFNMPFEDRISKKQSGVSIEEFMKTAYKLAKKYKIILGYSPTKSQLESEDTWYLKYTRFILLKTDFYQNDTDYTEKVTSLVEKLRGKNPYLYIMTQISVHPPNKLNISTDEMVHQIESVRDIVDALHLYYIPSKETKLRYLSLAEVLYHFRGDTIQESLKSVQNNRELIPREVEENTELDVEN
ncbi:hypothetical protein JXA34_01805 [Patescibacteria group bacterium]|nr:hypothetical protein [Patescibacteria group bacterium]